MTGQPTRVVSLLAGALFGFVALGGQSSAGASSELVAVSLEPPPDDEFVALAPRVGDLADGDVLDVDVTGFEPGTNGIVRQCERAASTSCRNPYPVRFDDSGAARFQFRVVRTIDGPCRRCSVELAAGDEIAKVDLWFDQPAPRFGQVNVDPSFDIASGDVLDVRVRDFPPGVEGQVVLCGVPAIDGHDRCGAVGGPTTLRVGDDGSGRAQFVVRSGEVGRDRVECGRGSTCAVAVLVDGVAVASTRPIEFADPDGAEYQPSRLIGGLVAAAALLLVAFVFHRRTDWAPVGEVAAPEIDAAEYADLDAIIAALPPEPVEVGDSPARR
jgi:hypothetical protein